MKPTIVDDKEFPYLLLDSFFEKEELDGIWKEVMYLFNNNYFLNLVMIKNQDTITISL